MTGLVLVVVLITKFLLGAWIAIAAMIVLFVLMKGIRRHYDAGRGELVADEDEDIVLPVARPRDRAGLQDPQADAARPRLRPGDAARRRWRRVTVNVDAEETRALQAEWDRRGIPVPLKVLDSPYREITRPGHRLRAQRLRRGSPRDVVTVFIPEYVVGHWWEHLLHNQSALRLKGRLLFTPGRDGDQRAVAAAARSDGLADRTEGDRARCGAPGRRGRGGGLS